VVLLGYGYRIRVEEAALKARFGETYERYAATRRRLIPFLV
jgi:protein-S-isoprenylcysteine O-methyltransferase Ste14